MNRHITFIIAASAMLASTAMAQSTIGYTTGKMAKSTICRSGSTEKQGIAIKLSHDKLQALAGKTINSVKLAFGSRNTTDKIATLFIATDINGEPISTQDISITKANSWITESLTSPYTITGNEEALYIGYTASIPTTYNLLQADHSNELRDCSFAWTNGQWTDLYGTGYGSANIYLGFSEDVAFTDAIVAELDLAKNYYIAGKSYQESTHLFNFGTSPINSIDVTILKGTEQSTITLDGLDIPQYGTYEFNLPELTADKSGDIDMKVKVSVNNASENDLSDNEFQSSAFFYPANIERNILVEEFTGMTCPNCPAGKTTLETAIEQSGLPCVEIMHHSGYSADDFTTEADYDYMWFYGTNYQSTYAPAAMFNRLTNPAVGNVPVINVGLADCLNSLEFASKLQPYASLALTSNFNPETKGVEAHFSVCAHNKFPSTTVINLYLIQDGIVRSQSGGGTEYVHNGVLRKVLTGNSWGLMLPDTFGPGASLEITSTFTVQDAIYSDYYNGGTYNADYNIPTDPEHMRIVAYIGSYDQNDFNNNMVYNCIEVPLIDGSYTQSGMNSTEALEKIEMDLTQPQSAMEGIFDLTGRRHDPQEQLAPGFYIINGKKIVIRK